jgi:hypothetical protein
MRRCGFVGWVERSDTHRSLIGMGIASLHPSYKTKAAGSNPRRLEFKIAG